MEQIAERNQERRNDCHNHKLHWQAMTPEQKMALYQLQTWGYRLLFVRQNHSQPLAVIAQDKELATLDADGILDPQPKIVLRH